jgi:DNA-binding transcriptional ArsR family regulator
MSLQIDIQFIASAGKALGDKYRLMILKEIAKKGSINCIQAQDLINLSQPATRFHIKQLIDCKLVDNNKIGREVYLSINQSRMREFLSGMKQIQAEGQGSDALD